MDFRWPAPRRDTLRTRDALMIATALTASAAAAVSTPLAHMYRGAREALTVPDSDRSEIIAFVRPTPPVVPPREQPDVVPATPPVATARVDRPSLTAPRDSGQRASIAASDVAPARDADVNADSQKVDAPTVKPTRPALGPVIVRSAFSRSLTQAERDAIPRLSLLGPSLLGPDPGRWRLVSDAEKEGFVDEERQRYEILREHKPADVAARGGLFSIPLGLFGGPSRAQRKRDSVINHDNLLRLGRLADRAQAKRDSVRIADSLARLAKKALP